MIYRPSTNPTSPPSPPSTKIPYRDRWPDDELERLRRLLWFRLMSRIHVEEQVADLTLEEIDRMGRLMRRDGERLFRSREREGRSWGRWLIQTSRELHRWVRSLQRARRP